MTPEERAAAGRAARAAAPRSSHAGWEAPAGRPDPVDVLAEQAASRVPELVPIRYGRMLTSDFAFFRGAAAVMAADLAGTPASGLRVQLCGDAHLSNFGGYRSPERALVFDINDFDETLPGPWEWDVKRLAASLAVVCREREVGPAGRRQAVAAMVRQYREAMAEFAGQGDLEVWYARLDATGILTRWHATARRKAVRTRLRQRAALALARDNLGALAKLTHLVDGQPRFANRPPLLVPVEQLAPGGVERAEAMFQDGLRQYRESLPDDRRHLLEQFRYVHFARKVVGVGSVGTRAWVVLLSGRDPGDPLMLQVKEAGPSVLAPYVGAGAYSAQGRRVVEGQRLLQATSDIFLGWLHTARFDDVSRDFYVRQLWDGKIAADVGRMSGATLLAYGQMCGWTLARAHARSGDRIALAAYLGAGDKFDLAIADFADGYAEQNARDRAALAAAVRAGRVAARFGV